MDWTNFYKAELRRNTEYFSGRNWGNQGYSSCYVYSPDVMTFGRNDWEPNRFVSKNEAWGTRLLLETTCSYCRMRSTEQLCPTCGAPKA